MFHVLEHKADAPKNMLNLVFERALKELPGSYKLWYNYLKVRRKQMKGRCVTDPGYDAVNSCFERCLVWMHKMPRIWMDYCKFLVKQQRITKTRRVFDRALRALPPTQHDRSPFFFYLSRIQWFGSTLIVCRSGSSKFDDWKSRVQPTKCLCVFS